MGPSLEGRQLPRLFFLSLASGSAYPDPWQRTAEAVRRQELATMWRHSTRESIGTTPTNWHLHCSVGADTCLYFSHVNRAKYCQNKPQRKQADKTLFENCRRFIPGELRVLSLDIVTQGGWPDLRS